MVRVVKGSLWTRWVGGEGERQERGLVRVEEQRTWRALVGLGVEVGGGWCGVEREALDPKANLVKSSDLEANLAEVGDMTLQGSGGKSRSIGGGFKRTQAAEEEDEATND
ncbi:hypothetical protein SLEP1_g20917 [Rubroshorea leprosula]|uniref:Uncharacterized protein n=1 Tax=Rubroshorea leprosula TaxID=152421 RepID=A0AAV5J462_9ROSI|nr:hypothetical protein SLEP1_g20917 [Rubroshorea leprosula]